MWFFRCSSARGVKRCQFLVFARETEPKGGNHTRICGIPYKRGREQFPAECELKSVLLSEETLPLQKTRFFRPCGSRQDAAFIEGRKTRLNFAISAPGESFQDAGGAHRG
jgi:hypothetical protein